MDYQRFPRPNDNNPLSTLGERLRTLRRERGLTQSQLAERAGFSKSILSGFESGRQPTLASLQRLADALGASVSEILLAAPDREIWQRFDRLRKLPEDRQPVVLEQIDSLLAQAP